MTPYETLPIERLLSGNPYPGRGVFAGMTPDGTVRIAYFIMGRSANSRNRVFTRKDGEVFTEPFDPSKVEDPSLIIYAAIRQYGNQLIVTNGDQTDTICRPIRSAFSRALTKPALTVPGSPSPTR